MRAEALLAQREYDDSELAGVNPNSLHSLGRKAAARLEVARREIARSFGARVRPSEIVLTNGGTEANQLALLGLAEGARQRDRKRDRVIVSAIEHDSIRFWTTCRCCVPPALPSTWCSPAAWATLSLPRLSSC